MFPDVTFNIKYADEDIGNNLGEFEIKNGKVKKLFNFDYDTPEANRFAFNVIYGPDHKHYLLDYGYNENYEYKEEK